jgi:hypothetical protein
MSAGPPNTVVFREFSRKNGHYSSSDRETALIAGIEAGVDKDCGAVCCPRVDGPTQVMTVISFPRQALDAHKKRYTGDGFIFAGERHGKTLNLDNLACRALNTTLGEHRMGWLGFRRGPGTSIYSLGVHPKVIHEILCLADGSATQTHHVVVDRSETAKAMKELERAVGKEWAKADQRISA